MEQDGPGEDSIQIENDTETVSFDKFTKEGSGKGRKKFIKGLKRDKIAEDIDETAVAFN